MMRNTFPLRRLLLKVVASSLLIATSRFAFGRAKDQDAPDKAGPDKAGPDKAAKGTAKKPKTAVLTVLVTGNGKPIHQAEVQVKFPSSVGGESRRPTDQSGEAAFNSAGLGTAKVRVIAAGWESALREVVLKEGSQQLPIKLNSLSEAKQPAGAKPLTDTKP
jgi:hypothetical protein